MRSDQRLTTGDVEAVAGQVLSRVVGARLLEEKDRNQVFAVGEEAILKAYLRDGAAKQARKVATLRFLEGCGLPVPRLLGQGVLPSGVPWTLETRVIGEHVRPTRAELATPAGWEQHQALGRWLPALHALGGFACFGTWSADGPARLSAHVLPRARAARAQVTTLDMVSPATCSRPLLSNSACYESTWA
jgi:aminoglycoside phosphotransferase